MKGEVMNSVRTCSQGHVTDSCNTEDERLEIPCAWSKGKYALSVSISKQNLGLRDLFQRSSLNCASRFCNGYNWT